MIENHVCALELAKRLKELGVKQESLLYYYNDIIIGGNDLTGNDIRTDFFGEENLISAFLASELLEWLPERINNLSLEIMPIPLLITNFKFKKNAFSIRYRTIHLLKYDINYHFLHEEHSEKFQDSIAKMLIHLIEKKLIEVPK